MARTIPFLFEGQELHAELASKIDKKILYGTSKRIVEQAGRVLTRGYLDQEGRLLQPGEMTLAKVDPEGSLVAEPSAEIEGQPAELLPSSFDRQATLEEVALESLVGFNVKDVYPLIGLELPEGLYRTTFSYRKTYAAMDAVVLCRADGLVFLLSGSFKQSVLVGLQVAYEFFDAQEDADEEDEELDFAMV